VSPGWSFRAARGCLLRGIARADRRVAAAERAHPQHKGMTTTLAAMVVVRDRVVLAHVGDSRIYRLRGRYVDHEAPLGWRARSRALQRLTRDHNGAEDREWRARNPDAENQTPAERRYLTRYIGGDGPSWATIRIEKVAPDDTYLLCTDGLHDLISPERFAPALQYPGGLRRSFDRDCTMALTELQCAWLLAEVKDRGAHDNVTMIVARFKKGRGRWTTERGIGFVVHGPRPTGVRSVRVNDEDGGKA
jgi:protein phosphatase